MVTRARIATAFLAASVLASACTVHQTTAPSLGGPSGFALSVGMTAQPDAINQDGSSRSTVVVSAHDVTGSAKAGQTFRLDMVVTSTQNGTTTSGPTDYGTLSQRTVVTGSDGTASVIYTAPVAPPAGSSLATCHGLPGTCVSVVATPLGSDFVGAQTQSVDIRLMPTGVILPPGQVPVASFVVAPTPVSVNLPAFFDASASCAVPLVGNACNPTGSVVPTITQYSWVFGDGSSATGKTVSHTYVQAGTFSVTLTVTNSTGLSTPITQAVIVGQSAAPSGDWVFSPLSPAIGDTVFFNADGVQPAPGRTIVKYLWDFGDGNTASGFQAQHKFLVAGSYAVLLTVTDDAGLQKSLPKTVSVGTGNPIAIFTVSPPSPVHGVAAVFDASGTTTFGGATIVEYDWSWGDGSASSTVATASTTHSFTAAGTYVVTLTVKDSASPQRVGVFSQNVTVQ